MGKYIVLLSGIIMLFCGCSNIKEVVEVPVIVEKNQYKNAISRDTVIIHDSIDRYRANDTVYLYKYRTVYKYKLRVDSVIQKDTIPVIVNKTITKEVTTNKMNSLQSCFFWLGIIFAIYIMYKLLRRRL